MEEIQYVEDELKLLSFSAQSGHGGCKEPVRRLSEGVKRLSEAVKRL
jgi:hypothetical protein